MCEPFLLCFSSLLWKSETFVFSENSFDTKRAFFCALCEVRMMSLN